VFDIKKFGEYVALMRKSAGMTQTVFAERLCLTRQSISLYETGECFPDISIVIQIAEIFDITIDELVRSGIPDT